MTTFRRLLQLGRVPVRHVVMSVLLGALAVGFGVALMTTAGYLISRAAEHPPILSLTIAIVAVRFFGIARPFTRYAERLSSHDLALRALARIRVGVYERIEPLAPAELEGYRDGEVLTRMVGDVDALQGLWLRGVVPPLVGAVAGAGCVVAMWVLLPQGALFLLVGLLLGGIAVPWAAGRIVASVARRQAATRAVMTADLVECLSGARELVVFGRATDTLARVTAQDAELVRLGRRGAWVAGVADAASVLVAGTTVLAVLASSVSAHMHGSLDRTLIATIALLAMASFDAVTPLPAAARELTGVLASGRRVLDITERRPSVTDPVEPDPLPPGEKEVALEGVTARYAADEPIVLQGLDLSLPPGRKVALLGPSGAGKSTVANLLLRFLDPVAGRVTIGGRDIRGFHQAEVRSLFALAGQEAHVFDSTIRANLALARPDADDHDLWQALSRARLDTWVASLPEGLETFVGEDGIRLSGGERQRLTVARALLADAEVLILDEPTSHLDAPTAEGLVRDVLTAAADRSVLLITHRPEGLALFDEVIHLEDGVRTVTPP